MSDNLNNEILKIIEVPPELRGPSDEEILKMSEKVVREVSGKRKKGERRPSKRRRMELKAEKALQEAQNAAREFFANQESAHEEITREKPKVISTNFATRSAGFSSFMTSADIFKPASGRVLKASFGSKTADKPKTTTVSAADLAKQRAEERAKKIREALIAKKLHQ